MHRIDVPSAVASLPIPKPAGTPGYFTQGSPTTGEEATIVTDDWTNAVQEEIATVIEQSGLVLSKTDHTQLFQALQRLTRRRLTAAQTFYVSPTGDDNAGDGLTPATAWATITHAYNWIRDRIDTNGFQTTIQLANGTHSFAALYYPIIGAAPIINGNAADPSLVTVNNPNGGAIGCGYGASVKVQNFTVTAQGPEGDFGNVGSGLVSGLAPSTIVVGSGMRFGYCNTAHMEAYDGGAITLSGPGLIYTVVAGAAVHFYSNHGSVGVIDAQITIQNNPAFTHAFCYCQGGVCSVWGNTFTGPCTGVRYGVQWGGIIITSGGGPNYFPGNAAGSVDATTYGIYV